MVADEPSLLDAIAQVKPCLVVVDLSLPDSGEVHIARRLMEAYPSLCLLVLSVHDDPTVVSQVCRVGAAGFVLKRTVATDLVPAIQDVLRGGTYLSPALQGDRCPASRPPLPEASDKQ
jgi:two-component system secretion response regulator SsrB